MKNRFIGRINQKEKGLIVDILYNLVARMPPETLDDILQGDSDTKTVDYKLTLLRSIVNLGIGLPGDIKRRHHFSEALIALRDQLEEQAQ